MIVLMIFKLSIDFVFGVVELPINDDTYNHRNVYMADFRDLTSNTLSCAIWSYLTILIY